MNHRYYRNGVCCLKDDILHYSIWDSSNIENLELVAWDPPLYSILYEDKGYWYYPSEYEDVRLENNYDVFIYNPRTEKHLLIDRLYFDLHYVVLNSGECCEKDVVINYSIYLGPYEVYPDWVISNDMEWGYFTDLPFDMSYGENVALRNSRNERRIITLKNFTKNYRYGII